MKLKVLTACMLPSLIVGCSSQPSIAMDSLAAQGSELQKVSGFLQNTPQGYRFTKFKWEYTPSLYWETMKQEHGIWVNFGSPLRGALGNREIDCSVSTIVEDDKYICNDSDFATAQFVTTSVGATDVMGTALFNTVVTPLKGLNTLAHGGPQLDARAFWTYTFDLDAYKEAVNQAYSNLDTVKMESELKSISAKFNDLETFRQNEVDKQFTYAEKNKSLQFTDSGRVYTGNKIDKDDLIVKVDTYEWDQFKRDFDNTSFVKPSEFVAALDSKKSMFTESVTVVLSCSDDIKYIGNYNTTTTNCNQQTQPGKGGKLKTVNVNIKSIKHAYLGKTLDLSDGNISITQSSDGILTAKNKTDSYINIESLSLYFGSDVSTQDNFGINLPPHSTKNFTTVESFKQHDRKRTDLTYKDLNKTVKIGTALKYRVVDKDKEITLYDTKNYRAKNTIL